MGGGGGLVGKYQSEGKLLWRAKRYNRKAAGRKHRKYQLRLVRNQRSQTFFRQHYDNTLASAVDVQGIVFCAPLASFYGTANDFDDLKAINALMLTNATGQTWPTNTVSGNKWVIENAHQELEVTNTSSSNGLYLNIYRYICKKEVHDNTMQSLLTTQVTWSGTAPTSTFIGMTPFDFNDVVDKITITSKTEVLLEPLANTTIHTRS